MKVKVFTLEEARDVLVKIKPLVEAINEARFEYGDVSQRLEGEEDELERLYLKTKLREIEKKVEGFLKRIEELGGVIKGFDPLLIDFLSWHKNRYIWLCWKEGEETINYWHELEEGFAGRKPVSLLFE